jgi:hypothetical protein
MLHIDVHNHFFLKVTVQYSQHLDYAAMYGRITDELERILKEVAIA